MGGSGERAREKIRYARERDYAMPRDVAWRLLADTDHLNRSIGLPAIDFSPMDGARGKLVRGARARAFGFLPVRWKEYPFEWVRERHYVVRREFEWGPVAVLEGGIELHPAEDGVRVKVFADFTPANFTGKVLWRLGASTVDNMIAFCDSYLARKAQGLTDPTPGPSHRPRVDRAQLESLIEKLRDAPVRVELIPLLEQAIVEASDDRLYRIRPYELADAWGADRSDVLRLFMHGARAGLFELRWELLCPNCRIAKAETSGLRDLPKRYHCDTCGIDYATEFDERVELRFAVHPSVRRIESNVYCTGGPLRMPHIVAQQYLREGEGRRLELKIEKPLRLRAVGGTRHLRLVPNPESRWASDVSLIYADGRWTGPHSLMTADDVLAVPTQSFLNLRNQTGGPLLAVIEEPEWTDQATTAAEVTTLSEFQQLFQSEMLAPGQEITVKQVALLASRLAGTTSLFAARARQDERARNAMHEEFVNDYVAPRRGVVVRAAAETVTCAFHREDDARSAAASIHQAIAAHSVARSITPPLEVAIGIHAGPVTAVNGDERIEYFGKTVDIAERLASQAQPGAVAFGDGVPRTAETAPETTVA